MRTLSDLFYYSVETYRKPDHFLRKMDGAWVPMSSDAFAAAVEEFSMGLRTLGVEKGDRRGHPLGEPARVDRSPTSRPCAWAASRCLPTRPLPAAQIRHILADSEARVVVVSNETQARKIEEIRAGLPWLRHVIRMDPPVPAGSIVVRRGAEHGDAKHSPRTDSPCSRRADEVQPRRPRDPHLHLRNDGRAQGRHALPRQHPRQPPRSGQGISSRSAAPTWRSPSFPLRHAFERTVTYFWLRIGAAIAFAESVERVPDNLQELKPTVMCSVPRLYEKIYARVQENVALGLRRQPEDLRLGHARRPRHLPLSTREARGPVRSCEPSAPSPTPSSSARSTARTGGRMKLFVSGGAPLAREIAEFLGAVGFTVCEGYGLTETSPVITANRPDRMRPGSVGLPFDGVEVRIAEDGEILTRGPHVMKGYFRKPEATAEILDEGRLAPHGRHRPHRRRRLPRHHRSQEGHHRHVGRKEHRAPAHRKPTQDRRLHPGSGDDRQSP